MLQIYAKHKRYTVVISSNDGVRDFSLNLFTGGDEMIICNTFGKTKTLKGAKVKAMRMLLAASNDRVVEVEFRQMVVSETGDITFKAI